MGWELKKYPMYYGGVKQTYPNIKPGMSFLSKSAIVGNIIFLSGLDGRTRGRKLHGQPCQELCSPEGF